MAWPVQRNGPLLDIVGARAQILIRGTVTLDGDDEDECRNRDEGDGVLADEDNPVQDVGRDVV